MRKPLPPLDADAPQWAVNAHSKSSQEYKFLIDLECVCRKHEMLPGLDPGTGCGGIQVLHCIAGRPLGHYLEYYFGLLHKNLLDDLTYCGEICEKHPDLSE